MRWTKIPLGSSGSMKRMGEGIGGLLAIKIEAGSRSACIADVSGVDFTLDSHHRCRRVYVPPFWRAHVRQRQYLVLFFIGFVRGHPD